jgi:hypothetical protein
MRVLPREYPGNVYGQDIVVATRETCALLERRGSDVRCGASGGEEEEVVVAGIPFRFVAAAADMGVAAMETCGA